MRPLLKPVLTGLVWCQLLNSCWAEVTVLFSPSPAVPNAIKKALDSASKTIDVAIYTLSDSRLTGALKDAASRNVTVRVMLNKASSKARLAHSLEQAGIDVRYVSSIIHHKFTVIDRVTLLTGSGNWSRQSSARFDDDLLQFSGEPDITNAFATEFERLWGHSREFGRTIHGSTSIPSHGSKNALFTSANMEPSTYRGQPSFKTIATLEDGVCGKRIIEAIDSARLSVRIAHTHFRRADIAEALTNARERGVTVQLLLDSQEYHSHRTSVPNALHDEELAEQGVQVRYKLCAPNWDYRTALQMHAKYLIVDDNQVLTGSLNWSENSELKTLENLVVISSPDVVKRYCDRFAMKWSYGQGTFNELLARVAASQGAGPCKFKPISLSGLEVTKLRKTYRAGSCR